MKKVLFTATVDSHILQFHLPFLKLFKENGYEVHVATNGNEEIPYCDVKHVVSFERSPININNLKAIRQLRKIINEEKFDIIHTHTPMGSVVTRLAAKKARKKYHTRVIYTAHGLHFFKGASAKNWLIFYPVEKYLSKYTDTLILINQEDYDLCKRKFKKCKDIQYVPGVGIDEEKFNFAMSEKEKHDLRKSVGVKDDDFVMIFVARMDKNKNQGMLINCTRKLVEKHPEVKLLLVGPDERNGYYQKMVSDQNLDNNVKFLGFRKDIPQLMKISDIALSSSLREGLPVNIMEAFASGLPVVANDCRGARDLIEDSKNGYVVDNEENMISKIELLLDSKVRRNISNNNVNKVSNYSISNIIEIMKKIYFRKKKILHVLSSNKYSGAENVACTIIENLKNEYNFVYCCPNGQISDVLAKKNIEYVPIDKLSYKCLKKVVKKYNPDIIHAHDYKASCYSALINRTMIVSHIHQNSTKMRKRNILTILYKLCSPRFAKIIYVSDSSLDDYYYKNYVVNKSIVLYNVIDISSINYKAKQFTPSEEYDLIFLGRLTAQKNPERLIRIMAKLKKMNNNIKLAIIGDGEKREILEHMINEYNLETNIDMLGYQTNPYPYLKKGKILIMTSVFEGTPMAVLEAMNFGLVIVSTPVDGLKKIIKNDYNGFLYSDDDTMASCVNELLNDKKHLNELSKNSKNFFLEYNDLNKYCNTIRDIYK